jgi:hypothetical protein
MLHLQQELNLQTLKFVKTLSITQKSPDAEHPGFEMDHF